MESEGAGFSGGEEGGLDLLASLLDNVEENEAASKPDPSSDGRKRKAEDTEREGEKRRKVKNSCDNGGSELAVEEKMAQMRAKMVKMEEELSRLRKQVPGMSPSPRERGTATGIITQRKLDKEKNCLTEKYSGIRIKNPLVSTEQMRQRMQGRKMVRIPRITSRMKDGDIEGDWVTIGVVVEKLPPRDTVKGKKFVIWRLSDLSSQTAVVSLFLFGQAYQEHWKIPQGHVVGLLNANIMPNRESDRGDVSLSLDHPQKLMLMGVSQDFTICKAHTKSGKKCVNFAKLSDGGYCDYHTQGAYRKVRSQRMEFQNGYGPSAGNIRERILKGSNAELVYYKGQSITVPSSSKTSASKSSSSPEMDRRLFAPGARASAAKVSRELSEQREENGATMVQSGRGVMTQEGSEAFKQMLKTQSLGARMLSRHYQNENQKKEAKHCVEMSASELLQMHKAELRQKSKTTPKMTKKLLTEKSTKNDSSIDGLFTPDCTLPLREEHMRKEHMRKDSGGGEKDTTAHAGYHGNSTKEKAPDMSDMKTGDSDQTSETTSGSEVSLKLSAQEKNVSKPNTSRRSLPSLRVLERQGAGCSLDNPSSPLLGRGMTCGATIELTSPTNSKPSRAKLRALAVVQCRAQSGSEDKAGGSKRRRQEAIQKRVEANRAGLDSSEGEDVKGEERPLKRPKMAAAEMERILNAKSSHDWVVKEDEWEREQEYFDHLEKKEGLEEKLKNIRELRVTVVQCSKCGYVAEHLGELCRKENHVIHRFKTTKRCFQCKNCRERCYTYNAKYPADLCSKCGGNSFEPTSLYKERQGPKLLSEQLLLRGTEEKYLNSLQ